MSRQSSLKRRNVSADANDKPMKVLFHPRMDSNIRPGDHAPLLVEPRLKDIAGAAS